jgi:hypothetical protein
VRVDRSERERRRHLVPGPEARVRVDRSERERRRHLVPGPEAAGTRPRPRTGVVLDLG